MSLFFRWASKTTIWGDGMNLIEKLGLEKCKQIVGGAPNAKYFACSIETATYWLDQSNEYHSSPVLFPNMSRQFAYVLDDLRTAIANHGTPTNEGTDNLSHFDHCSDIRNHVSPNTVVTER